MFWHEPICGTFDRCDIYVVNCASLSTELKFVSESNVIRPNYAEDEVEDEEGETDDNDSYENVTFTVKKICQYSIRAT